MEQPTRTTTLEQTTGLLILGIIVIVGIIFWVIKPQMNNLKEANAKVKAKTEELTQKQEMLSNMNALESEIKSKASLVNKLNIVLPYSSPGASGLVLQLNNMAKAAGVTMKSLTPTANESETNYEEPAQDLNIKTYSFTVDIVGNYSGVSNLFKQMEKNLRPITIKNISIASAEDGDNPTLSITIDAETYYSM
jgi:Tfp pilus assembly protein PilO